MNTNTDTDNVYIIIIGPQGSGKSLLQKRIESMLEFERVPIIVQPFVTHDLSKIPQPFEHQIEVDVQSLKDK